MSGVKPLELTKVRSEGDVNIHLITSKADLDSIAAIIELKDKIAERVSKEELVYSVPSKDGLTIIAKAKEESETSYRFQSARSLGAKLKKCA